MSNQDKKFHERRRLMGGLAALSASSLIPSMLMRPAMAANITADYKALVCVYLYGGNDGNNLVVPFGGSAYQQYAAARNPQSGGGLTLPQSQLLPLVEKSGATNYGLHPSMKGIQSLWNQGKATVLFNVGTLRKPTTRTTLFQNYSAMVPYNLYSHADQQMQMQAAAPYSSATGFGGRMIDIIGKAGGTIQAGLSVNGYDTFLTGAKTDQLAVPSWGSTVINGNDGTAAGKARTAAISQLNQLVDASPLIGDANVIQTGAYGLAALSPIIGVAPSTLVSSAFTGLNSGLAYQLQQVAKLIQARTQLGGPTRQIFYVGIGGFDTHSNEIQAQASLLNDVSTSMTAFYNAVSALGLGSKVTAFTLSEFGRTLKPAAGGGSDHAWGNHHVIVGDAVNGLANYGTFPHLVLNGPDDSSSEGRWIPTTAIEQYGATLAKWFGYTPAELATVFPNLSAFPAADLGFLKAT